MWRREPRSEPRSNAFCWEFVRPSRAFVGSGRNKIVRFGLGAPGSGFLGGHIQNIIFILTDHELVFIARAIDENILS